MFYEKNEIEFNLTKERVFMEIVKGVHQLVKLEPLGDWNHERIILYLYEIDVSNNRSSIEKVYRILSHKSAKNMG